MESSIGDVSRRGHCGADPIRMPLEGLTWHGRFERIVDIPAPNFDGLTAGICSRHPSFCWKAYSKLNDLGRARGRMHRVIAERDDASYSFDLLGES